MTLCEGSLEVVEATLAHVVLVAPVPGAPRAQQLVDALRRESLHVSMASADVLRDPPTPGVYAFYFDAAIAHTLAATITAWSSAARQVGMLGLVEDGGGTEREVLLSAGFDDVVTGRLSVRELAGRVRALVRRLQRTPARDGELRFAGFSLDLSRYQLYASGAAISLTPIELAVMRELMKARGKPLSRGELLEAAWRDGDLEIAERAVDNVVLRLRRKLPDPDAIETVRGVGFRIVAQP